MEAYQWIHPAAGLLTLLLLTATAWTKLRSKKYSRLHYALALVTVLAVIGTFALGLYTFARCDCDDYWPPTLPLHFVIVLLFMVFILGQRTMGVSMLLFGRKRSLFRMHRFNARIVSGLAAAAMLLGVTTLGLLLTG